jgi:hypothetical protein
VVDVALGGTARQKSPPGFAPRSRSLEEQQRRCKDPNALFSLLRTSAERAGVFVLLLFGYW